MGFKFNPLIYTGLDLVGTGSGPVTAAYWKAPAADFASLPAVGNTIGDVRLTLDTGSLYAWDGATWVAVASSNNYIVDKFTLSGTDISNKFVTLSATPVTPSNTCLDVIGGIQQDYSTDFTVTSNQLSWDSLGLDGILTTGDKLIITYSSA